MNTLGDALKDAYAEDARRLSGLHRGPHRTISAIRRRRAARAAVTGTSAAVVVAAFAFGATAVPGLRTAQTATPGVTCVAHPLALANPKAFGALAYVGRSIIDDEGDAYTFVHADGTVEELALDADGTVRVFIDGDEVILWAETMSSRPGRHVMDWVRDVHGVQGTGAPLDPAEPMPNTWAWNVEVPDEAPDGVDVERLSWLMMTSMFGSGGVLDARDVPEGATVTMSAHGVGSTWTVPVQPDRSGPGPEQTGDEGLTSLELIVTLADGGTYAITAHHDADAVGPQICVTPSASPTASPSATPSSSAPTVTPSAAVREGEALSGPESEVFVCGGLLRDELNGGLGLDVTVVEGSVAHPVEEGATIDGGGRGILIAGTLEDSSLSGTVPASPGWSGSWTHSAGATTGVVIYSWPVSVRHGQIVGTLAVDPGDHTGRGPNDVSGAASTSDGRTLVYQSVYAPVDRMVPCPGFTAAEVEDSQVIVLLAREIAPNDYEYGWIALDMPNPNVG